jgi:hypothetical protein
MYFDEAFGPGVDRMRLVARAERCVQGLARFVG